MPLPSLKQWEMTRAGLHQAAQVLGAVRQQVAEPLPNYLHLGLQVCPEGLTTGPLPFGGELILDFARHAIRYAQDGVQSEQIPLARHNQVSLADAVLVTLTSAGHALLLDRAKLAGQTPFVIEAGLAADYASALNRIHTAMSRFRSALHLPTSPLVLWPHNFDLAFLAFANPEQTDTKLHAGFGFEPRSPGLERPYFYTYIRPTPDALTSETLPPPARWHTEGWTGVVFDYDDISSRDDPERVIQTLFDDIYKTLLRYLQN